VAQLYSLGILAFMKISDLYVVEWSEQQHAFHVTTVDEMLAANREVFLSERESDESDWLVLALERSYDSAHAKLRELKAAMDAPAAD
jgi:hypothetical protein